MIYYEIKNLYIFFSTPMKHSQCFIPKDILQFNCSKQKWLNKHDSSNKQNDGREDYSHFNCKLRRIKNKLQLPGLYQHNSKYI